MVPSPHLPRVQVHVCGADGGSLQAARTQVRHQLEATQVLRSGPEPKPEGYYIYSYIDRLSPVKTLLVQTFHSQESLNQILVDQTQTVGTLRGTNISAESWGNLQNLLESRPPHRLNSSVLAYRVWFQAQPGSSSELAHTYLHQLLVIAALDSRENRTQTGSRLGVLAWYCSVEPT